MGKRNKILSLGLCGYYYSKSVIEGAIINLLVKQYFNVRREDIRNEIGTLITKLTLNVYNSRCNIDILLDEMGY
jgi:hypothetical protein